MLRPIKPPVNPLRIPLAATLLRGARCRGGDVTKAVYAFANDPTQSCYLSSNILIDDTKSFHTATPETPTSPLKKAAWYDINGDGILDFVSNGVYVWNGNDYSGFTFGEKSNIYDNIVNVGGDNGILWYSNYVRHIDTANFSATILDGDEGEGAYFFSPCNGGKNGVPVPTHKPLLSSSRLTIPMFSITAGTYEVQVQGVDLMHEASDFSEVYEMIVDEDCSFDIPTSGFVGYPVKVSIFASIATDPDWDGGEAKSSGAGRYNVV